MPRLPKQKMMNVVKLILLGFHVASRNGFRMLCHTFLLAIVLCHVTYPAG